MVLKVVDILNTYRQMLDDNETKMRQAYKYIKPVGLAR